MSREETHARLTKEALAASRGEIRARVAQRGAEVSAVLAALAAQPAPAAPASAPPSASPSAEYVRALYEYQAQDSRQLSLAIGDIIAVMEKNASGWWVGRKGAQSGVFPGNYVQPLSPSETQAYLSSSSSPPSGAPPKASIPSTGPPSDAPPQKTPKGMDVAELRAELSELQKSLDALTPTSQALKRELAEMREAEEEAFATLKATSPVSFAYYGAHPLRHLHFTIWRIIAFIELPDQHAQLMSDVTDLLLVELQQFMPALTAQAKDSSAAKAIKARLDPVCIELQQKLTNQKANSADKSLRDTKPGSLYDNLLTLANLVQPLLTEAK